MAKEYFFSGKVRERLFNEPVQNPHSIPLKFIEYVMDDEGNVCGAKILIDLGHGYGFNNGEKEVVLKVNEEIQFFHEYTDTSDGTWDDGSYSVVVRLVEK